MQKQFINSWLFCSICSVPSQQILQFFTFLAIFCLTFLEESIPQFQFSTQEHFVSLSLSCPLIRLLLLKIVGLELLPISLLGRQHQLSAQGFCGNFHVSSRLHNVFHFDSDLKRVKSMVSLSRSAQVSLMLLRLSIEQQSVNTFVRRFPNQPSFDTVGILLAAAWRRMSWYIKILSGVDCHMVVVREISFAAGKVDRRVLVADIDAELGLTTCVWDRTGQMARNGGEAQGVFWFKSVGVDDAESLENKLVKRKSAEPNNTEHSRETSEMEWFWDTRNIGNRESQVQSSCVKRVRRMRVRVRGVRCSVYSKRMLCQVGLQPDMLVFWLEPLIQFLRPPFEVVTTSSDDEIVTMDDDVQISAWTIACAKQANVYTNVLKKVLPSCCCRMRAVHTFFSSQHRSAYVSVRCVSV